MKTQTVVYAGPSNQEKFGARISELLQKNQWGEAVDATLNGGSRQEDIEVLVRLSKERIVKLLEQKDPSNQHYKKALDLVAAIGKAFPKTTADMLEHLSSQIVK